MAATDHVLRNGLIGLSLRPLGAAIGTSDRMLLYHFRDKDDCFLQAFDVASEIVVGALVDAVAAEPDPVRRIECGVRAYLAALVAHPEFARLFLTHMRAAAPQLVDRYAEWVEMLAGALVVASTSRLSLPRYVWIASS